MRTHTGMRRQRISVKAQGSSQAAQLSFAKEETRQMLTNLARGHPTQRTFLLHISCQDLAHA